MARLWRSRSPAIGRGALLPAIYWLHRRWPIGERRRNLIVHVAAVVPFSIVHTVGMAALRFVCSAGSWARPTVFRSPGERMLYEFAKDIIAYGLLSAGTVALRHYLSRPAAPATAEPPVPSVIDPPRARCPSASRCAARVAK